MMEGSVYFEDEVVPVKIIRKNNKNIYFRFDQDSNLVVTVPLRFNEKKIFHLIEENKKSLERMWIRNKKKQDKEDEVRLLGLKYDLVIDDGYKEITFDEGIIYASSKSVLDKYISNFIKKVFTEEINKILAIMPNIPKFTLKVRKMKSRWGVCNYVKKTVTLNSELIKYEREIIDYVIVHEFSHFTHHNHSSAFWDYVSKFYPEYKKARKELREE